ncbi:hypothetical protein T484DRAFT_1921402 [Baffinella frigidus]|nr:hypothetical protein T484DRAFT_1921402 [Cryptophyta sp. CCMP2293]
MSREHTFTTPVDFINAFCGTQTSQIYPAARPRTYTLLAEDLLLCAFGATPRPEDTSAYCNAHAGAARWLQRATMPQRQVRRGSECAEEETVPELAGNVFARCSSMPDCPEAVQAECSQDGQNGAPAGVSE